MRKALRRAAGTLLAAGALGLAQSAPAQQPTFLPAPGTGHTPMPAVGPSSGSAGVGGVPAGAVLDPSFGRLEQMKVELAWTGDIATFGLQLAASATGEGLEVRGFVPNEAVKARALELAKGASGMEVKDSLKIYSAMKLRVAGQPADEVQKEAAKLLQELLGENAKGLQIAVRPAGQVTVSGAVVLSVEEKLAISKKLRQVPGCTCVVNQVTVPTVIKDGVAMTQITADGAVSIRGDVGDLSAPADGGSVIVSRPGDSVPAVPAVRSSPYAPARPAMRVTPLPAVEDKLPMPRVAPSPTFPGTVPSGLPSLAPPPTPAPVPSVSPSIGKVSPPAETAKPSPVVGIQYVAPAYGSRPLVPANGTPLSYTPVGGKEGGLDVLKAPPLPDQWTKAERVESKDKTVGTPEAVTKTETKPATPEAKPFTWPSAHDSGAKPKAPKVDVTASKPTVPAAETTASKPAVPSQPVTPVKAEKVDKPATEKSAQVPAAPTKSATENKPALTLTAKAEPWGPPAPPPTPAVKPTVPTKDAGAGTTGLIIFDDEPAPGVPAARTTVSTPVPTPNYTAAQIKKAVESACGKQAREVRMTPKAGGKLLVVVKVADVKTEKELSERILRLPEVDTNRVQLEMQVVPGPK